VIPIIIFAIGLYCVFVRFTQGLGASTNLSDQFPWGLWIGFDVLCGVALAAGAFTLSAAVYVLHLDNYKPLVRAAILTGFIGYLLVIIALMFDLGHPYRIWHPLIMWNPNSVMFEISWCVTLYFSVLAMEVSNFLFEKVNWQRAFKVTHAITVPLVITGVILSTLHQSSLGSLFLIVPYKLHALWYSPWLPVFFFNSAMALGCAMVIVESFISSKIFKKELELSILTNLSRALVVILAVYGIARAIDINDRDAWDLIFQPGFEHFMFLAEILLAIIGPIILLSINRVRINRSGLFISALMVVIGFILNRFNVSMTGLIRAADTKYIPSWMEISVTIAIVTLGLVLFGLAVKYLDIFKDAKPCLSKGETCSDNPSCCLPTPLWFLIIFFWAVVAGLMFNGIRDFYNYLPNVL
jgi:Ni/Fe-hydrogenase subunit HybB-like protein